MTLTLPKAQAGALAHRTAENGLTSAADASSLFLPAAMDEPVLASQQILLVEDDMLVAEAMRRLLQSWGQEVRHVATAEGALRETGFGQIAICDVRLPRGASGLDVAVQLRRSGKAVLLISGETDLALREAAERHALPLLTKPVSSARLRSALHSLQMLQTPPASMTNFP